MPTDGRYLDVAGAASYLCVSRSYLNKPVSRRRIPFAKIGRRVLFDRLALDKWTARRPILPKDWIEGGPS